jgi:hypothetical protein
MRSMQTESHKWSGVAKSCGIEVRALPGFRCEVLLEAQATLPVHGNAQGNTQENIHKEILRTARVSSFFPRRPLDNRYGVHNLSGYTGTLDAWFAYNALFPPKG